MKLDTNIVWQDGKVSYKDRCKKSGHKGLVVWFTGLSGAGKSTIAVEVEKELIRLGKAVYRLDGDNIRHGLCSDLGFTKEDRIENIRRIIEVASLFKDAGLIALVSCISPYRRMREIAKKIIGYNSFLEVYVKTDIKTCIARDPKGLYKKALEGQISDFTGISSKYEEPENPDLTIDTNILTIEESTLKVIEIILNEVSDLCQ